MNVTCSSPVCPVILNSTCVFYEGESLIYTGINTNDSLQTALQKIDAALGVTTVINIYNSDGTLTGNRTITSGGFTLTIQPVTTFTAAPAISTLTQGSVLFAGSGGTISQNNTQFFWDNSTSRLGLGTGTPLYPLHIVKPLSGGSLDVVLETKDTTANNTLYFDNNAGKGLRIHTYGTAVSGTLLDGTVNRANASVIRTNDVTYPIIIGGLSTSAQNVYFGQNNISLAINNATQSVSVGTGAFAGYKFDVNGTARITSTLEVDSLAGVGNRMVVADASGVLSTQSIPTGSITGNGAIGQVTYWNSATTITGSNSLFWDIAGASLGIGSNALTGYGIRIGRNITGATISAGVYQSGAVQSDVSTLAVGFSNTADVSAGVVANAYHHFRADQSTFGAGATLAFQAGFFVTSTLTSATNNYGFYGNLASGIGRWNLFMAGTAPSYFNGVVTIGTSTPNTSAKVQIDSTTQGFLPPRMTLSQKNLITTPAEGLIVYQTDGTKGLYVYDGASWRAITII